MFFFVCILFWNVTNNSMEFSIEVLFLFRFKWQRFQDYAFSGDIAAS